MYKKTISGLSIIAAAFGLAAFSAPASAWSVLNISGVNYADQGTQTGLVYSGSATLYHWAVGTLNCTLTATGDATVTTSPSQATIEVTNLSSSGSTSCSNVSFQNLPLVFDSAATPSSRTSPTTDTSNGTLNIDHSSWSNICDDYIDLTFQNDGFGGSSFTFSQTINGYLGDCSINGTLTNSSVEAY